ncbi:hypothetical protein [Thermomonospora catenispora]|uniref:hypothetical protein n=1 Tax=Thermomonospora catenispora TaxID=2493090 RepID=UPI001123A2C2|nr:hypothetical protein [Thermomonospora catenispora]TNY35854.1 hypothetical protein EIO00_16335 [Thermomonospora catenispora]
MSAFNSYNALMGTAQLETDVAQFILPPAVMIGFQFRLAKGNPLTLESAAQKWDKASTEIGKTVEQLRGSLRAVPATAWDADDRRAYETKVDELCSQLTIMQVFCKIISIALLVLAWALFAFAIFAVAIGTFLAGLAAVAVAALAGVFTAPVYAKCLAIAGTCLTITYVATGILAAAAQLAAGVFQGGTMVNAALQHFKGNEAALGDFAQAQLTASATALANLAQNAVNGALAFRTTPGATAPGVKTPVPSIDLDADRNANHTWNVGGGATVNAGGMSHTVNGHVKWGDEGFAGGDLSYQGKHDASGLSFGGNVEYTDEDGIGRGKDGSFKYGANVGWTTPGSYTPNPQQPNSPSVSLPNVGVTGGISGEHNFETGQGKVEGYGSVQAQGGDVHKRTGTVEYGGPDGVKTSSKVETPFGTTEHKSK